jgi:hypothetical protein
MEGWIKLHRSLLESDFWKCEPFSRGQAWVDLLMLANFKDSFFYKRGVKVDVKRGQVGRSEVELSDRWKWSRTKVRKFLKDLEKEQQIKVVKTSVTQIVTVLKYEEFQSEEQQKDSKRTTKEQQKDSRKTHIKNEKNDNNEEEYFFNKREELNIELANSSTMVFGIAQRCRTRKLEFDKEILKDLIPLFTNSLNNEDLERKIDEQRRHCANWVLIEIEKIKKNESKQSSHDRSKESYNKTANAIFNTKWDEKPEFDDF